MKAIDNLRLEISQLERNIAKGKEFEAQGYEVDMMMTITQTLLNKANKKLRILEAHNVNR